MMAQPVPHQTTTDRKRVKVYELRNNDWFDRGTGFCTAAFAPSSEGGTKEPRVIVESEDQPDRLLLQTAISKEDGFQKQQDTLIVWTEPSTGIDMALSFQEAEGCSIIWKFINNVQQSITPVPGVDDNLSDDLAMEMPTIQLPPAELGHIGDLEANLRILTSTQAGRESLAKPLVDENYLNQLVPLFEAAEDLEALPELHRLCNIMKMILLVNDNKIIDRAVSDECVMGVVGALEYDPDFPSHKANHRQWLNQKGRYKEVVRIEDNETVRKIHQTYRLQYLKDVVLARILDDSTFGVLNSMIFYNQVEIVTHLDGDINFLKALFGIFADPTQDLTRKKDAVLFIQQSCAIAKNLQPGNRAKLYHNLLQHGLLQVINFGLRSPDVAVRVGATDILVSMIDHDPHMIRHTIYRQITEKQPPLTDTLIELLLVEVDLGVKSQISDALKVLLDSNPPQLQENGARGNPEMQRRQHAAADPQQEIVLVNFYEKSAARLFRPLLELEKGVQLKFNAVNDGIFSYLTEILCFYLRQHQHRSKYFILQHNIVHRYVHLLDCKEKHLRLVTIRFFKQLMLLQDEFYLKQMTDKQVFGPVLDVLIRTLPKDNLLSSACLDLFELVLKLENRGVTAHLVETYREKLTGLSEYETFKQIIKQYDQTQYANNVEAFFAESEEESRRPSNVISRSHMEHLAVDPAQEEYWNASDDDDDNGLAKDIDSSPASLPSSKPLVDYNSDEEADEPPADTAMSPETVKAVEDKSDEHKEEAASATASSSPASSATLSAATTPPPPERISEKRRREQDEDDELDKLMMHKRRNSSSSVKSTSSTISFGSVGVGGGVKKKTGGLGSGGSSPASRDQSPHKNKISIIMGSSLKSATAGGGGQEPSQDENA